jgi:CBS domain-containing protein
MALTAADVMTDELITVTPTTPLAEFARICAEDRISGAPVVEVDGKLVGIISKTDLIDRLFEDDPRWGTSKGEGWPRMVEDIRQVQDVMSTDVITVGPHTPIGEIAARMADERIHRVVVVDDEEIVGLVTSLDVLTHFPR